jgi:hypothetical protein
LVVLSPAFVAFAGRLGGSTLDRQLFADNGREKQGRGKHERMFTIPIPGEFAKILLAFD